MAIDYGSRRIGVALADPGGRFASPADVLPASRRAAQDARKILDWAAPHEVGGFVVGLPLNMDGTDSDQTRLSRKLAAELLRQGAGCVELWDERLSSFQADQTLQEAGVRRSRRRRLRDAVAAQVILQSFLDSRPASPAPPPSGD